MMPRICIINAINSNGEKHCGIESQNWTENFLSHYNLKDNIEEFIKFYKLTTIYDLYTAINMVINPSDKYIVNIEDLYYTSDYVYQAIFKTVVKDSNHTYTNLVEDSNKLATQLLGEKHVVDGNMIVIKRSIFNKDLNYEDIALEDITTILKSQLLHKAVVLKDNDIYEQYYIYSPLEIHFNSNIDNVRYHEFRFLDFRLFFHVDINADRNNLNKKASGIYGQNIYGNVLISLTDNSDSTPTNLDLTIELINNIYCIIMYHRQHNTEVDRKKYARNLEIKNKVIEDYDPTKHINFEHNGFPEITLFPNFFQIVKLEYNDIKNKFIDYDISFQNTLNDVI